MMDENKVDESIIKAINSNDLERVKEIVNRYGLSYCQHWDEGYFLLWGATGCRCEEMALFLIEKGAKVNSNNCTFSGTPLHNAVQGGSLELVEILINQHASIEAQNHEKETPLDIAIIRCKIDMVRLLLDRGADCWNDNKPLFLSCIFGCGDTAKLILNFRERKEILSQEPLHLALAIASIWGKEEVVSILLNAGADPNAIIKSTSATYQNSSFYSEEDVKCFPFPLLSASHRGHLGVVKLLVNYGALLDCSRQDDDYTPLHIASKYGHVEIVRHLLNAGANPNAEADDYATPLHVAVKTVSYGQLEVVRLLLNNGADVNAVTYKGSTPLHFAVKYRYHETAELLLEWGACVNTKDIYNNNALYFAVEAKTSHLVSLILQRNPNVDDIIKKSVIRIAINDNSYNELVDFIMEYDSTFSEKDISYPQLLPAAVKKGYSRIVECILNYGLDQKDGIRNPTLLHVAVKNGHAKVVELLLKAGYDVDVVDEEGERPICYSMRCKDNGKRVEIFQLLLAYGAVIKDTSKFFYEAIKEECLGIFKILIENYIADVNAVIDNEIPLIFVSKKFYYDSARQTKKGESIDRIEMTKLLLSKGADVHFETESGETALSINAARGHHETARILLHFGADVNLRSKESYQESDSCVVLEPADDGPTPLHLAAGWGNSEVVKVLLEYDVDIDMLADGHRTALHNAVLGRNPDEITKVLLESGCDINVKNDEGLTALDYALWIFPFQCHNRNLGTFPTTPDSDLVCNLLIMHAVKLRVAGLHISEKIKEQINHLSPALVDFQKECEEEIKKLKSENLCCHLSLYDILMDSKNPAYVKNESLRQTLDFLDLNSYPIYGSFLVNSFERNKRRVDLLNWGSESLNILIITSNALSRNESPILPTDVSEKIVFYLSSRDLKSLISASEAVKNQVCK